MYRTALVRQIVLHFAELAGWEGDRYFVTLSRIVFDRAARRFGASVSDNKEYGATLVWTNPEPDRTPVTWINPAENITIATLARTCAHEALHSARPTMRHGRAYEKAVTRLTRGQEP